MFRQRVNLVVPFTLTLLALLLLVINLFSGATDRLLYDNYLRSNADRISSSDSIVLIQLPARQAGGQTSSEILPALIERLAEMKAQSIGLLTPLAMEPPVPAQRQALANALLQQGSVYLRIEKPQQTSTNSQRQQPGFPPSDLMLNSAGLTHLDYMTDEDGLLRHLYLYAGLEDLGWPTMALSLWQELFPDTAVSKFPAPFNPQEQQRWYPHTPIQLSFRSRIDSFIQIDPLKLLDGVITEDKVAGKIIIIADVRQTEPSISTPIGQLSQLQLTANALDELIQDNYLQNTPLWIFWGLSAALTLLVLPLHNVIPRRYSLTALPIALCITFVLSLSLFAEANLWFSPLFTWAAQGCLFCGLYWYRLNASRMTKAEGQSLYQQLNLDPVTHLPSETMFKEQLDFEIREKQTDTTLIAVVALSLKGLPENTPTDLIQKIAHTLHALLDYEVALAHRGENGFYLFIPDKNALQDTKRVSYAILHYLQSPWREAGQNLQLNPKIGISVFPEDGSDTEILCRRAEAALKTAEDSADIHLHCTQSLSKPSVAPMSRLLKEVLQNDSQLPVHFHPVVNSHSARILGFEAVILDTYRHQTSSIATFLRSAKSCTSRNALERWLLQQALNTLAHWRTAYRDDLYLTARLTPELIGQPGFVSDLRGLLNSNNVPATAVQLQISEADLFSEKVSIAEILPQLRDLGISLMLTEFGASDHALTDCLKEPISAISLHNSLIDDLEQHASAEMLAQRIINQMRDLKLALIAKGVKSAKQRGILMNLGVQAMQGSYFYPPLAETKAEALLKHPSPTPRNQQDPNHK